MASFIVDSEGCDTSGNPVRSGRNQLEIIGNQLEITEIWLEIRNQGLENPVETGNQREITRNQGKKSRNPREITRNTPFLSEHAQETFRACAFEKSARNHARNQSHEGGKSVGNQLEITAKAGNQLEITEIRKSRTPRRPVS